MSAKNENVEMITIPKEVYLELQKRDRQLTYLENYGVDNWGRFQFSYDRV